jgi:hypothetical protein
MTPLRAPPEWRGHLPLRACSCEMLLVLSFSDWCCHSVGYTPSLTHHLRLTGSLASSAVSWWPFVYVLGRNRDVTTA